MASTCIQEDHGRKTAKNIDPYSAAYAQKQEKSTCRIQNLKDVTPERQQNIIHNYTYKHLYIARGDTKER